MGSDTRRRSARYTTAGRLQPAAVSRSFYVNCPLRLTAFSGGLPIRDVRLADAAADNQQASVLPLGKRPRRNGARSTSKDVRLIVVASAAAVLGACAGLWEVRPFHRVPLCWVKVLPKSRPAYGGLVPPRGWHWLPAGTGRSAPSVRTRGWDHFSIGPRHPEHVLADVGQHEVVVDRRDAIEPRLAELALDVELDGEAVAAVGIQAGVGGVPGGLRGQQLGHVGFGAAALGGVEQPGGLEAQQVGGFEAGMGLGDGELDALVGADRSAEDDALGGVTRGALDEPAAVAD